MAEFNLSTPPKSITDPAGSVDAQYPAHVHKYAGPGRMNEFKVVTNDEEKAAALKDGWSAMPVHDAPEDDAPKDKAKGKK